MIHSVFCHSSKPSRALMVLFLATNLLLSCKQEKVKVLWKEYSPGKPMIIYYFDNKSDAQDPPDVVVKDGLGSANKPVSFDEERFYVNGPLQSKGRYIKGKACGRWEYFYDTGIPMATCYYQDGVTCDTVYCWYPSGKLKRVLVEIDTIRNYWHGSEYFENGKQSLDNYMFQVQDDKYTVEGPFHEWYENGQLKYKATVKNGYTIGKSQSWNENGMLIGEKIDSLKITFDPS
jgi:antitoxin component YwqK of YwqJK toxin-antitoxin module